MFNYSDAFFANQQSFLLVVAKFLLIKDLTVVDGAMPYFEAINKPSLIFFMGVWGVAHIFKARYSPSSII